MAFALTRPRRTRWRHSTGSRAVTTPRVAVRPVGASFSGGAAAVVGAWAAIAVFVGPYFGFRPTTAGAWSWNLQNGLLHLAPGAVALVAGLMIMVTGPARRAVRGGALTLPAILLLAAGAWLVIGPVAWPTFESGPAYAPVLSSTRNLLNQACAGLAPGLVLAALGGMALKAAMARPVVTGPAAVAPAATAPVREAGPVTTGAERVD